MPDNYGLTIVNTSGRYISNGSNPLLTDIGTFNTSIIPGTNGGSVEGFYGVWCESPQIKIVDSPLPLVRCNTGYTSPYCVTDGAASIITSSPDGATMNVCAPLFYSTPKPGTYGIENYDSSGRLIFSSNNTYPDIVDVIRVPLTTMDSIIINSTPQVFSHATVDDAHYIISGLNAAYLTVYADYSGGGILYAYWYSWYRMYKPAIHRLSNNQVALGATTVGYQYSDPYPDQSIGYSTWLAGLSLAADFGDMTRIYYLEFKDGYSAKAVYRWSYSDELVVLVCRKRN